MGNKQKLYNMKMLPLYPEDFVMSMSTTNVKKVPFFPRCNVK